MLCFQWKSNWYMDFFTHDFICLFESLKNYLKDIMWCCYKCKQAFWRKAEMGNFELHAVHFSLNSSSVHSLHSLHSLCLNCADGLKASTCGARECWLGMMCLYTLWWPPSCSSHKFVIWYLFKCITCSSSKWILCIKLNKFNAVSKYDLLFK